MHLIDKKAVLFLFASLILLASCSNKIWQLQSNEAVANKIADCKISNQISKYTTWKTNFEKLKNQLATIPIEYAKNQTPIIVEFPDRNGKLIAFKMYQSQTMSAELANQFPDLKSYMGNAVADNSITIRANLNETGFHALLSSTNGQWLIEPYCAGKSKDYYCCYWKSDFKSNREPFNEKR
jgi:hypothetical protein